MLLTLDVGNTNISIGVFASGELKATWRIATDLARTQDEYGLALSQFLPLKGVSAADITAASMCSVVPPLTGRFVDLVRTYFQINPLVVTTGVKTGIHVLYDNPRDVGADRIVDAVAALNLYGGPVIVVDFGTATVFDAITKDGEYLGGALAPGITLAADALYSRTSLLRPVELIAPEKAIGISTSQSLQSGIMLGYMEMVKGMVARFEAEMGGHCKVVATGGLAGLFNERIDVFNVVNEHLTLEGLSIIHGMNQ